MLSAAAASQIFRTPPVVKRRHTHARCQRRAGRRRGDFYTGPPCGPLCYDRAMPPRRRRRGLRTLVTLLLLVLASGLAWQWWHWPDVAALARRPPTSTAFIDRWRERQR